MYKPFDMIGTWYKETDEKNDRPIYKRQSAYWPFLAFSSSYWVVTSKAGSGSGVVFGDFSAPKCPNSVSVWKYYDQTSKENVKDYNLKVTCATRK